MADVPGPLNKSVAKLPGDKSRLAQRINWLWVSVAGVLVATLAWAYWPTLADICNAWLSNPDYTHGFFVVPISLWLLWLRREQAPKTGLTINWSGLGLLILAGAIRCVAGRFYVLQLDAWSIPIWVAGIVWLLFGWAMLRWALPAIAFLWFATPLPGTIEIFLSTPLQSLAASLSALVLRLIGQPAIVEGTTILIDDKVLDVERACSGLRMFYGIFALAVACIVLARPPRWKAVLVLCAAAPVAIIANVVRIVITAVLIKFASSESAAKFSHDFAGLVMIPLAVTLFLVFLVLLGRVVSRLSEAGGVAWLTKWCLAGVALGACILMWSMHQEARALSTLLDTAARYESEQDWTSTIRYLTRYVNAVPDDADAYTRLARLYQAHATSYQDQVRAVELLQTAWRNQPKNEDLAVGAIQIALQIQDFDEAIALSNDLLTKSALHETRAQARKLKAAALYAYIQSDRNRGDSTWENVKDAFEDEFNIPNKKPKATDKEFKPTDYDVTHVMMLVDVYRNPKTRIEKDENRETLATELLDKVIKERPTEPMAWLSRSRYRLSTGKAEDKATAEADLARAIELTVQPALPMLIFTRCAAFGSDGTTMGAPARLLDHCARLEVNRLGKNASSATVLITAAIYKTEHRDVNQATSLLELAIEIAPTDTRPYLMLSELKTNARTQDSTDEAVRILEEGIKQIGKNEANQAVLLNLRYASLLVDQGKLREADSTLAPIEGIVPKIAGRGQAVLKLSAGLVRSQILLARDGPQPAMVHLRDLLGNSDVQVIGQQMPDMLAKGYALLAQVYSALGLSDLALDSYRQAARIQPTNAAWKIQSAALAQQAGDLDSAEQEYRAVGKGQATGDVLAAIVEVEIKRQLQRASQDRDWKKVEGMLKIAGQKGASPLVAGQLRAEILSAKGERENAEKEIVKLTKEFPKEPVPWRTLALMRLQRTDIPGAQEAARNFADVANQSLEATALKAGIDARDGKTDDAIKALSDAAEKAQSKDTFKAAAALSQLLAQAGKADEARTSLEKAHEKDPNNPQIVDALANSALMLQDWKALEKYEGWLNTIEGSGGTSWRGYRAQRMLATAQSPDDKDFQEAVAQVEDILRKRPHWSKAHYLQGEIAIRLNRADIATAAYERSWKHGGRGVLLADRLIDLLTKQGNLNEARQYVTQVRDYLSVSQGLFDRAISAMAPGNDIQEMADMAQKWVEQKPNDSEAHLRLGRVLLMLSNSSTGDQKQKYVEQATKEFRRAIKLTPNDVRPWAAVVMLLGEPNLKEALQFRDEFANQTKIGELERAFVLAQLNEILNKPSEAQIQYNRAATLVEANPKAAGAGRVLGRVARFYSARVPELGEFYADRALEQDPANPDAKLVLLNVYVNRTDARSAEEGLKLLDESKTKTTIDPAIEMRYRAALLARRGRPNDVKAAIDLLRGASSQSREDKLLLARMYERSEQIPPALELLQQLVRAPNANATELTEFLRFWQQHFVATADGKAAQFTGQANEIYDRLGELDNQLPERLRWKLRELKAPKAAPPVAVKDCMKKVEEVLALAAAKKLSGKEMRQLLQFVLIVLLQEQHEECALQFAMEPPNGVSPTGLAVLLCNTYVAVPQTKETAPGRKQAIDTLLATHGKSTEVLQAVGDCLFMAAEYERAADSYRQVLRLKPDERMVHNNLALALVELQKFDEARDVLAVVFKDKPDDPDLLDTEAVIDIMDNHADKAIAVLEKLVEKFPESPVLWFHLAVAYNDTKNASAREAFYTAVSLGVQQRILSPRDTKTLADFKARYMTSKLTSVADRQSSDASQARH